MHALFEQMNTVVSENREGVSNTVRNASDTVRDLQSSVQVVADNIDAIMHYLEGSGRNMQEFTREVRENPGVLFGGRSSEDPLPSGTHQQ